MNNVLKIFPAENLFLAKKNNRLLYQNEFQKKVLEDVTIYPNFINENNFGEYEDELNIWSECIEKTFLITATNKNNITELKRSEIFKNNNVFFNIEEVSGIEFIKSLTDEKNIFSVDEELVKKSLFPQQYFKYDDCETYAFSIIKVISETINDIKTIAKVFELDNWISGCILIEVPKCKLSDTSSTDIMNICSPLFGKGMKRSMVALKESKDALYHISYMTYDSLEDDPDFNRFDGRIDMFGEYQNMIKSLSDYNIKKLTTSLEIIDHKFGKNVTDIIKNKIIFDIPLSDVIHIFVPLCFYDFMNYIENSKDNTEDKIKKIDWMLKNGSNPNICCNYYNIIDYLTNSNIVSKEKFIKLFRQYGGLSLKEELSRLSVMDTVKKFNFDYTNYYGKF